MAQRYTAVEVERILSVPPGRLRYWERLRLVRPQARWGARFYSFADLVALRMIERLTRGRVAAVKLGRALQSLEAQFGEGPLRIEQLRLVENGREVAVIPPAARAGTGAAPFNPLRRQWLLPFEAVAAGENVRVLPAPSAEELFERALRHEQDPVLLGRAIQEYRQAVQLAPNWIEARINLGVALYQGGRIEEAREAFAEAVRLDPCSGIAHYNLGCVLEEQGKTEDAIRELESAARLIPPHADTHFNLALAYETRGDHKLARDQWLLYLRHAPQGPWAEQARARLAALAAAELSAGRRCSPPIPFPCPK